MTSNDLLKSEKGGWGGRGAVSSGLFVLLNSMIKKICRPKGTFQKRFSGIRPLRGGGVPPFSAKEKNLLFFRLIFR